MQYYWQVLFLALQCWRVPVLTGKTQKGEHLSVGKYRSALHFCVCAYLALRQLLCEHVLGT